MAHLGCAKSMRVPWDLNLLAKAFVRFAMGSAISKGANGLGSVIGNAFSAPFKSIFGGSCEDICSGPWDVICFIEHLCFSSLVKLLMILALCYVSLLFLYLLFKLGICQCIGRNLCKMCWVVCEACWFALEDMSCCLWHKLINTKRVYRGRRRVRDVELGYRYRYSSTDESDASCNYKSQVGRKRKSLRKRRNDRSRRVLGVHHFARLKGRSWSWRLRSSRRRVHLNKARNRRGKAKIFKRRRLK
ncbi:hypothetical protein E2542_SST14610 [Spatholobus suberectus]|nr:hypothetical protein E2542_SST14610 [Spatholobus suberectus]